MKISYILTYLLTLSWLLFSSGCEKGRERLVSDSVSDSELGEKLSPSEPYIDLSSDKAILGRGEIAVITVTFVNPTSRKVRLPEQSNSDDEYDSIDHRLVVEWREESGISFSPISAVSIHSTPPSTRYLAAGKSQTYRLKWANDYAREGIAILKYQFGWSDDFPPAEISLIVR
ncbi:MAG: hypothetical protein ACSHX6_07325 [Akkermansiaceae bacterium]